MGRDPSMASGLKLPVSPVLLLSLLCLEHAAAGLQEVITPPPPADGCGGQSRRAAVWPFSHRPYPSAEVIKEVLHGSESCGGGVCAGAPGRVEPGACWISA